MAASSAAPAQDAPKPDAAAAAAAAPAGDKAGGAAATDKGGKDAAAAGAAASDAGKGGKETPGKGDEPPKPPDKYTLTVPENGEAYVDDAVKSQIEALARKAGWSNDDANAALSDHVETMRALSTTYLAETTADKEYGGEHLEETKKFARLAISKIRPEGHPYRERFVGFLNRFAGENNLNVVAFLADVGRLFAEDQPPVGKQSGGKAKTAEEVLYGTPTKK